MYRLPSCAECAPRPGLLLGLIRARARCSPRGTSFGRSVQPRPPNSGGDGGPTYLRGGGFLPSRKCLGAPSPPTPLNGYTFTLFRRIHAGTAVPLYASRRSTCTTVSGLSRFWRTTTRPLSNTLVMSTGLKHGNCSFVPRVRSSVMS